MGKILEQIISPKIVQIANKHPERDSTPLIITEKQILSQQGMITHSLNEKVCQPGEGPNEPELSYIWGWKWYNYGGM